MGKLAGLKQAINKARRTTQKCLPVNHAALIIEKTNNPAEQAIPLLDEYLEPEPEGLINADISL